MACLRTVKRNGWNAATGSMKGLSLALGFLLMSCAVATDISERDTGVARVELKEVPPDARCLQVTVEGRFDVDRRFDLTPGESAVLTLPGLPLGNDTFTGFAYGQACSALEASSEPTWLSDPVETTLSPGHLAKVALVMHRNSGQAEVTVDFEGPDSGMTCLPLLALSSSPSALSPAFDANVLSYRIDVPVEIQTVTLTPSAADGVTIAINGKAVQSGQDVVTPVLALGVNTFRIMLTQSGCETRSYTVYVWRGAEIDFLTGDNTDPGDYFGHRIAMSSDTIVIGALGEASAARGVNDITVGPTDNSASFSGAAYVFVRSGNGWIQQAYLKASNTDAEDSFGRSVALFGDTIVVGAPGEDGAGVGVDDTTVGQDDNTASISGAAYVFVRANNTWTQQAYLKASDSHTAIEFGVSVAISRDTIVVGSDRNNRGAAYVFERTGDGWTQQGRLEASDAPGFFPEAFGFSVAIADDTIVVGAPYKGYPGVSNAGAAYVFVRANSGWTEQATLRAIDPYELSHFGNSVAISLDTIVIGAAGHPSAARGINAALDYNTDAPMSGAAYVFVRDGSSWSQQAWFKASNSDMADRFGESVAIAGETIVVGAPGEDSAAKGVNDRDIEQADNHAPGTGAAYVFVRTGTSWTQRAYLKASDAAVSEELGAGVAVFGDTVVAGAPFSAGAYVYF